MNLEDYQQKLIEDVLKRMEDSIASAGKDGKGWVKPWFTPTSFLPYNPTNGTVYSGINRLNLTIAASFYGDENRFVTFNQMKEYGKKHNLDLKLEDAKGRGIPIFKAVQFQVETKRTDPETGEKEKITLSRYALAGFVFNVSLIKGFPEQEKHQLKDAVDENLKNYFDNLKQALTEKSGLTFLDIEQDRAYYYPSEHKIVMPKIGQFGDTPEKQANYYSTLLHEIGHSTGKELGRNMSGKFGSPSYAKEELVAEIYSMFMATEIGLKYDNNQHDNHVEYLKSWVSAIREDKNYLFKAASQAQQAVELVKTHSLAFYRDQVSLDYGKQVEQEQARLALNPKKSAEYSM